MNMSDRIKQIFSEKLHVDPPTEETDLIEAGVLDSFMFVELLLNLEQAFGLKIMLENVDLDNFKSIDRIANFVAASNGRPTAA
jgi:acyl carrier protein